jgi:molybdopterin molybdotransferase
MHLNANHSGRCCAIRIAPSVYERSGEGGIRTLGSLLGYGALAKRCFRPLSHLTKICSHGTHHTRIATNVSREYREELGFSNLQFGFVRHRLGRVLAISSELPIVDCQLIRFDVISEQEARIRILEKVSPLAERAVPLAGALDCFAAQDYFARLPLPAFDNSAMDGYAVVASSCKRGGRLRVIGEQPAGPDRKLRVNDGEAVRIFTGATLPQGADAIVMQEDVTRDRTDISLNVDVEAGEFVRRRGCDLAEGQIILARGEPIRAATVALLASQGLADVIVGGKATAAVISTGDELVKPGEELQAGQIYDSNSVLLSALLQRCGVSATTVEHCRDDRQSLGAAIKRGIKNHMLIIAGGVSVGEHDLVKEALCGLGAKIEIWRVAVKPGKPLLFGRMSSPSLQSSPSGRERRMRSAGEGSVLNAECLIFGLPGNPVSAFVTFLQFVRPAVLRMMGAMNLDLPQVPARLAVGLTNDGDRPHYIRGRVEHEKFTPIGRQESHALFGLSQGNALLRVAVGQSLKADEVVDVQIWD